MPLVEVPSIVVMRSSCWIPALSAGPSGTTFSTEMYFVLSST